MHESANKFVKPMKDMLYKYVHEIRQWQSDN